MKKLEVTLTKDIASLVLKSYCVPRKNVSSFNRAKCFFGFNGCLEYIVSGYYSPVISGLAIDVRICSRHCTSQVTDLGHEYYIYYISQDNHFEPFLSFHSYEELRDMLNGVD